MEPKNKRNAIYSLLSFFEQSYFENLGDNVFESLGSMENKCRSYAEGLLSQTLGQKASHIELNLEEYDLEGQPNDAECCLVFIYSVHIRGNQKTKVDFLNIITRDKQVSNLVEVAFRKNDTAITPFQAVRLLDGHFK